MLSKLTYHQLIKEYNSNSDSALRGYIKLLAKRKSAFSEKDFKRRARIKTEIMTKKEIKILRGFQRFIQCCIEKRQSLSFCFSILSHDINGLNKHQELFSPKTLGSIQF
jgi:hypothetical protein